MVTTKRAKNTRQRGSWTHGWGSKKKHRGAGSRGGRGRAGTGKRGDAKKPTIWKKYKEYFGRHYFTSIKKVKAGKVEVISLGTIAEQLESWKAKGTVENDTLDLTRMGYVKLLSQGSLPQGTKLTIIVGQASAAAKEKAEKAGAKLELAEVQTVKDASPKKEA